MYENYEKCDMLECYIESNKNSTVAGNLYFNRYPERRQPFKNIFSKLHQNLTSYGSFTKPKANFNINEEAQEENEIKAITVLGTITIHNGKTSTRKLETETGIPRTNIMRILKNNKYRAFRTRKIHHLLPADFIRRTHFCEWFMEKTQEDPNFALNCIWTDEASISSAGIYNRYNEYTWAPANPHVTVEERNQGRFSFNVWVGICRGQFIGPYIYDGALNCQRYLHILEDQVEPFIEELPITVLQRLFFQHDGAPPHCAGIVNNYLDEQFGENWMGNQGPIRWPARSPDLTPLDFFLWGRVKDLTYKQPFNTREELEEALLHAFNQIPPLELINAANGIRKRCRICLEQNGGQFEHLLT